MIPKGVEITNLPSFNFYHFKPLKKIRQNLYGYNFDLSLKNSQAKNSEKYPSGQKGNPGLTLTIP